MHKRVNKEIEATSSRMYNEKNEAIIDRKEVRRLLYCVMAFRKAYRKPIYKIWEKTFGNTVEEYVKKTKTSHVSGLPLPEQAEVNVWWKDNELILASTSTEFSLPMERVMGMGITKDTSSYWSSGDKTYLTIEYKKEDKMKSIVVRVTYETEIRPLIKYFEEIKGARETIKQEL